VVLGDQGVACAGCRARTCPLPGQPCLAPVGPDAVVAAVAELAPRPAAATPPAPPAVGGPAGRVVHGTVSDLRWGPAPTAPPPPTVDARTRRASPLTTTPSQDIEEVP
jgi:hypothetical protein